MPSQWWVLSGWLSLLMLKCSNAARRASFFPLALLSSSVSQSVGLSKDQCSLSAQSGSTLHPVSHVDSLPSAKCQAHGFRAVLFHLCFGTLRTVTVLKTVLWKGSPSALAHRTSAYFSLILTRVHRAASRHPQTGQSLPFSRETVGRKRQITPEGGLHIP